MSLIAQAVNRSRPVILLLVFLMVAGLVTYQAIPKESAPDVKIPIIYVSLYHEGIAPEDAERLLIRPIEEKTRAIEGVKEVKSIAHENGGEVILEFQAGFNSQKALADVREKVDEAKNDLPEETEDPVVKEVNFSLFPVLVIHLAGQVPDRALYKIAQDLKDRIEEKVSSVLEVTVVGDREEAVEIIVDPKKIEKYSLNFQETINLFSNNNTLISAGTIDNVKGRFSVKLKGLMTEIKDILEQPVGFFGDKIIKFSDIAEIRRTFKDPLGFARFNGTPSISLEVSKRTGENIIETIEKVQDIVNQEKKFWPEALSVKYSQDESQKIRDMLSDLENNVIAAILLVMSVILLSLGWRLSLLVGLAVPGSFLIGILVIALQGATINIVVLFSLILSVGMLVDGAIIVAEYAEREISRGLPVRKAFIEAAQRMTWPVITSTVTIIAAFLPLLFWPGIVGQFMRYLPLTLIATLTASIVMALIFLPTLGALFKNTSFQGLSPHEAASFPRYIKIYRSLLERALNYPGRVLGGIFGLLVSIIFIFSWLGKGTEFFPSVEPENASIQVRGRGNFSVWERDALVRKVEKHLLGMKELKSVYANTNLSTASNKKGQAIPEDTIGIITVEFSPWQTRRKASVILQEVLHKTKNIPGLIVQIEEEKPGPPTGKAIHLELSSRITAKILPALKRIRQYLETVAGLKSIEDTSPIPGFEWVIEINRAKAALFGATVSGVGQGIRLISNGVKIDTFRPDDSRDEIDILVRYPKNYRTLTYLENLFIQTPQGVVPISSFTKQSLKPKLDTIHRVDGSRVYEITADTQEGVLGPVKLAEIQKWLNNNPLDPDIRVKFKGEDEEQKETSAFLGNAFLATLFLIAIILVTQFNSFFSMGLVLSAVFLSTIGVLIGLLITGRPFNIVMGGIGVIALGGIIVSNNIIFIDTFDHLKKHSANIREIILSTGTQRIRPVLLTQITTVLGLLPMMFKLNINFFEGQITYNAPSSQWWVDLSSAIVFGVTFATILTLIVTPCALMVQENTRLKLKEKEIYAFFKRTFKKAAAKGQTFFKALLKQKG